MCSTLFIKFEQGHWLCRKIAMNRIANKNPETIQKQMKTNATTKDK